MISVYDEDKLLDGEIDLDVLEEIWCELLTTLGLKDKFEAEITVVGKDEIKALNKETRGVDSVTDVLSFPAMNVTLPFDENEHGEDVDPENGNYILGDIALCAERAVEQAKEFGHSVKREVCYLVLHQTHRCQYVLSGFVRCQKTQALRCRQFNIYAHSVCKKACHLYQPWVSARNCFHVDITLKITYVPESVQCRIDQFHRIIRTL